MKINEEVYNQFPQLELDEEGIRNYLRTLLSTTKRCINWDELNLYLRRKLIFIMMRRGLSKMRMAEELMKDFGCTERTAYAYIKDAFNALNKTEDEVKEDVRQTTIERLQAIIEDCLANGRRKDALAAYDQLNKINGLYSEKREIKVNDIRFEFGGGEG